MASVIEVLIPPYPSGEKAVTKDAKRNSRKRGTEQPQIIPSLFVGRVHDPGKNSGVILFTATF